jgi:hypothetical protein
MPSKLLLPSYLLRTNLLQPVGQFAAPGTVSHPMTRMWHRILEGCVAINDLWEDGALDQEGNKEICVFIYI